MALLDRIRAAPRPVVLIDGGSGAGKTTFARGLAAALRSQLVSLDDIYPGWDGLQAGSDAVHTDILAAVDPHWHHWDWALDRAAERHPVDPVRPLVIEGCGSLSAANRRLATFGIWLELDEPTRKARALARDGETFRPHWQRWAEQEREFARRENPSALADLVVTEQDAAFW